MNLQKTILVVEDDADDREILVEVVHSLDPEVDIVLAVNGVEALRYLGAVKEVGERPCLIVLDLNMPYLNGRDTFERIRNDAGLRGIPVIIFTSSLNPHDKAYFTGRGADFVTKPDDYKELNGIARRMIHACTCDERP